MKCLLILLVGVMMSCTNSDKRTVVSIQKDQFYINNKPTYKGRYWNGHKVEGLLLNSRMVNGIFDDENPETKDRFKYPDTGEWDPERNTREFVESMELWKSYGLNSFTLNLQGGSPTGYGNRGCIVITSYSIHYTKLYEIHFYYNVDIWEFYDLKEDPHELVNQYNNPEHHDLIAEMKVKLNEQQRKYGDDISLA